MMTLELQSALLARRIGHVLATVGVAACGQSSADFQLPPGDLVDGSESDDVDDSSVVDVDALLGVGDGGPPIVDEITSFDRADYATTTSNACFDYFDERVLEQADGVALFKVSPGVSLFDAPPSRTLIASEGELCSAASDPSTCLTKVGDAYPNIRGFMVIETRGDEVHLFYGLNGSYQWMKVPDSAEDAVLLATQMITLDDCRCVRKTATGWDVLGVQIEGDVDPDCTGGDREYFAAVVHVPTDGDLAVEKGPLIKTTSEPRGCAGRRPTGAVARAHDASAPIGPTLAKAATDEAASVPAFLELARDLASHGAPDALVAACRRAAADEVHHAAAMGRLAAEYGALPEAARVRPSSIPSLLALAVQNAVEGCVGEGWNALLASHQAGAAKHPELASTMAVIAADEIRHAALATSIDAWIRPLLTDVERELVGDAARQALAALQGSCDGVADRTVRAAVGLPSLETRATLLAAIGPLLYRPRRVYRVLSHPPAVALG
ncbi:MAG: hypothetical protein IV100_07010 [Myxococcales bacterium]|nr:hypothetical protein [Myxococcales bacterium]